MVRPGCRGPGGEPNARALPILPGRGSYGMTSAASRKAALSRRRPRPRRHREGCRRVTARRNRPLDRELSCANRRRPCSSRPLRQTSSIRAGPTGRPACYPLFSSPGISSAFPEPGTKPTSTYASKLAAAESLLSDRSAAPPKLQSGGWPSSSLSSGSRSVTSSPFPSREAKSRRLSRGRSTGRS